MVSLLLETNLQVSVWMMSVPQLCLVSALLLGLSSLFQLLQQAFDFQLLQQAWADRPDMLTAGSLVCKLGVQGTLAVPDYTRIFQAVLCHQISWNLVSVQTSMIWPLTSWALQARSPLPIFRAWSLRISQTCSQCLSPRCLSHQCLSSQFLNLSPQFVTSLHHLTAQRGTLSHRLQRHGKTQHPMAHVPWRPQRCRTRHS